LSKIFFKSDFTKQDIDTAGENATSIIYGWLGIDGTNNLCYNIFQNEENNAQLTKSINPEEFHIEHFPSIHILSMEMVS